ncbi:GspE/PulE/PilB domain-containing protein [Acidimangrovimonas sediminis]|uniref:GspE/PulE/PilB domain-containing protein n=1 Tax=Acidimangrovimonas sediminis TaxID=2056283 RepID=UPI0018EC6E3B|nr:hypothetical protein [Acidimangrovimonas sediminis]
MDPKLRQAAGAHMPLARPPRQGPRGLLDLLVARGALQPAAAAEVLALAARQDTRLADILSARDLVDEAVLLDAQAELFGTQVVDLRITPPDPRLIDSLGAHRCMAEGLAPWRRAGGVVVIATARPELFERHRAELTALFGPVAMAVAAESALTEAVMALRAPALARRAETRVAPAESCRPRRTRRIGLRLAAAAAGVPLMLSFPEIVLAAMTI